MTLPLHPVPLPSLFPLATRFFPSLFPPPPDASALSDVSKKGRTKSAREAFQSGDVELSRLGIFGCKEGRKRGREIVYFDRVLTQGSPFLFFAAHSLVPSEERHMKEGGQYIKAIVFGGLDGIITTFAVVASVAGADLSTKIVIIMVRGEEREGGCESERIRRCLC